MKYKYIFSTHTLFWVFLINQTFAFDLSKLSNADANLGLQTTLEQGAEYAVSTLGRPNGFLKNNKVHIPLPKVLQDISGILKVFGLGDELNQLENNLNHSAELAVATAKPILFEAIKQMTITDAKQILEGGDNSVTKFFRNKTSKPLFQKFLPIVQEKTSQLKITDQYQSIIEPAVRFNLIDKNEANLNNYVTNKAISGLFTMIEDKEKTIRKNPTATGIVILEKVFGKNK